jgi:hypothetical protein
MLNLVRLKIIEKSFEPGRNLVSQYLALIRQKRAKTEIDVINVLALYNLLFL